MSTAAYANLYAAKWRGIRRTDRGGGSLYPGDYRWVAIAAQRQMRRAVAQTARERGAS